MPFSNSSTFPQVSSQLRLADISFQDPNSSLEFYLQNQSSIRNIPLPYRVFSSPHYSHQIDEPLMPKNDTLDSETASYFRDTYSSNSINSTQYSVASNLFNGSGISHGEQIAVEKTKIRMKRNSESSSQVKRSFNFVIVSSA
jgi:hypothetical protein